VGRILDRSLALHLEAFKLVKKNKGNANAFGFLWLQCGRLQGEK